MNDAKFKSSLSSKLEFWLDYCSLQTGERIWHVYQFAQSAKVANKHDLPFLLNSFLCPIFGILKYKLSQVWGYWENYRKVMLLEWNNHLHCLTGYDRVCKSVNLWKSHASLAPEASNIPNKIQVLNWGLIWSFPLFIQWRDYLKCLWSKK